MKSFSLQVWVGNIWDPRLKSEWFVIITQKVPNVSSQLISVGLVRQFWLHIQGQKTDKLNDFCKTTFSYAMSNPIQVLKWKGKGFLLSSNYPWAFSTKYYQRNQRAESYNSRRCHTQPGSNGSFQREYGCTCWSKLLTSGVQILQFFHISQMPLNKILTYALLHLRQVLLKSHLYLKKKSERTEWEV